jgi:hypothetical protein
MFSQESLTSLSIKFPRFANNYLHFQLQKLSSFRYTNSLFSQAPTDVFSRLGIRNIRDAKHRCFPVVCTHRKKSSNDELVADQVRLDGEEEEAKVGESST